jgi:hypothetical protein
MTKLFQAFTAAALMVSVSCGAASAQSPEPSAEAPLPVKPVEPIKNPVEAEEAEKVLESFAECVAKAGSLRSSVAAFLGVPAGQLPPPALARKVSPPACLGKAGPWGGQMRMDPALFRQALYTALYRREFRKSEPTAFTPATAYESEFEQQYQPLPGKQVVQRFVGDCASARNLAAAHGFVVARVRSDEEASLLGEIVEALSHCIPEGEQVELTRPALKGMLAESLYKFRHGMTQTQVASAQ